MRFGPWLLLAALCAAPASAQSMNVSLSRLSTEGPSGGRIQDPRAYRSVMTQLAGSMIPPILSPPQTRGSRALYLGVETWLTGIDDDPVTGGYWYRAAEGDVRGADRAARVNGVLTWGRFSVRKALPFGFEVGANIGALLDTSYATLGLEVRWALFEGFRDGIGWIPDVAVRGAVQTLVGDDEFNLTIPSVELMLGQPFTLGDELDVTPYVAGQWALVVAESELVDLSPGTGAFEACDPDPADPVPGLRCPEVGDNVVFPSLRSSRWRLGFGAQVRWRVLAITGAVAFDLLRPHDADGSLDPVLPRQWQVDIGVGLQL
jgi:hypothetical protein